MSEWRTIETATYDTDTTTGERWLSRCLLLLPSGVVFDGMLSGGVWLYKDPESDDAWFDLTTAPTHWMPLPPQPTDKASAS